MKEIAKYEGGEGLKRLFPDINLSEQAEAQLDKHYKLDNVVDRSALMTCPGAELCPHAQAGECPIAKAGDDLPIGQPCPIEAITFDRAFQSIISGVIASAPDEIATTYDMSTARDLASVEVLIRRVQKEISKTPSATIDNQLGVDKMGEAIVATVENPSYKVLNSLYEKKAALHRQLIKGIETRTKLIKDKEEAVTHVTIADIEKSIQEASSGSSKFEERMRKAEQKNREDFPDDYVDEKLDL